MQNTLINGLSLLGKESIKLSLRSNETWKISEYSDVKEMK